MDRTAQFLKADFQKRFHGPWEPRCWRAPGRVNLIGEHTDYTGGLVLPIALDMVCHTAWDRGGDTLDVFSENFGEGREWPIDEIGRVGPDGHWTDYVMGVARELFLAGFDIPPGGLLIDSAVPLGSGLSSSAALEVAVALALLDGREMPPLDLARLCRRAENEFVGTPCGIMDQYVAVFGREGSAIRIDCRSLESEAVALSPDVAIIAVNSMVKHELGRSAYRDRVRECHESEERLGKPIRDATLDDIERLPEPLRRRARHVVTENARVMEFGEADSRRMGELFVESHRSLQHDYEVSCVELDFLVDRALEMPGVLGARMTGGGFGGCTVNLVEEHRASEFTATIANSYTAKFGVIPQIYPCRPALGAGPLIPGH